MRAALKRTAIGFATIAFAWPWVSDGACAGEITFKLVVYPNTATSGYIWMKKAGDKDYSRTYPVPSSGTLRVTRDCEDGMLFQARVSGSYTAFDDADSEKNCTAGEISFMFRAVRYAETIRRASTGEAIQGVAVTSQIRTLQTILSSAVEQGNSEAVLKTSSDIYNRLLQQGLPSAAEPYRVLNFSEAKAKLNGGELKLNPNTKRYELGDVDLQAIKRIQAENNLEATGRVDWRTMESIAKIGRVDG